MNNDAINETDFDSVKGQYMWFSVEFLTPNKNSHNFVGIESILIFSTSVPAVCLRIVWTRPTQSNSH